MNNTELRNASTRECLKNITSHPFKNSLINAAPQFKLTTNKAVYRLRREALMHNAIRNTAQINEGNENRTRPIKATLNTTFDLKAADAK